MVNTMKNIYIDYANSLGFGDFTKIKTGPERTALINKIANGYCEASDNQDEFKRNHYISALMLLFWGEISKMASKCRAVSELDYDDFASKLYECIEIACQYRAWKDGKHSAEACIRATISSRGTAAILYESNLDKNKANVNRASLDASINDEEGHKTSQLDLLEDSDSSKFQQDLSVKQFIQSYLDKNKIIEGIIFDTIANNDCQKYSSKTCIEIDEETGEKRKYVKVSDKFWAYKVVQILSKLPDNYFEYFYNKYDVEGDELQAALEDIKQTTNQKLYKFLSKTLETAKLEYQY